VLPCSATSDQITITINPTATAFAGNDTTICETDIITFTTATMGGSTTDILWTTSGNGTFDDDTDINTSYTPDLSDISNGSVTLTVTTNDPDNSGPCTETSDDILITINEAPIVYAGPDTAICEYDTYTISGASMFGSSIINWSSSGDGTFSNTGILNPQYTPGQNDILNSNIVLTMTSGNPSGPCNAISDSMLLKINTSPILSMTIDSSTCSQSDGGLTVTPIGGVYPYTYLWSEAGETDSIITGLSSGIYSVTVIDDLGCYGDTSVNVYDIGAGTIIFDYSQNILCYGDSTGIISVSMIGGTPPYSYTWSNGLSTDSISQISAGTYTVTVTDNNSCIVVDNTTLSQPSTALNVLINTSLITCYDENDGNISFLASGGSTPYSYIWSNGLTDTIADNLSQGTYIITVTDNNACQLIDSVNIYEPSIIEASIIKTQASCPGSEDGEITTSASGGTGTLSYIWEHDSSINDSVITNLLSGTYQLTVSDINNCSKTFEIILESIEDACLLIPTLFTPNNDDYNDKWEIKGIQFYSKIKIEVFNRWGDIVYYFDDSGYKYMGDPWKGEYNGTGLPMGAYVFIINLYDDEEPRNGVVSIKR